MDFGAVLEKFFFVRYLKIYRDKSRIFGKKDAKKSPKVIEKIQSNSVKLY